MIERIEFFQEIKNSLNYEPIQVDGHKTVCSKNSEHPWTYAISEGLVKVYDTTSEGQKRTIILLKPGETFPLIWAFDHPSTTTYSYECITATELYKIDHHHFKETLSTQPSLSLHAMEMFVHLTWDLMERVKCLQMPYTYEKLVRAMPYLAAKAGTQLEPLIFSLPRWVTQDEIAQLLGTSRESITVHIKKARELGLFTNTDDGFQIDLSKIEDRFIYSRWFSKRNSPQERAHP